MALRRQWDQCIQDGKRKNKKLLTKNPISIKTVFHNEGEIKTFSNKQKLKEFIPLDWPGKNGQGSSAREDERTVDSNMKPCGEIEISI